MRAVRVTFCHCLLLFSFPSANQARRDWGQDISANGNACPTQRTSFRAMTRAGHDRRQPKNDSSSPRSGEAALAGTASSRWCMSDGTDHRRGRNHRAPPPGACGPKPGRRVSPRNPPRPFRRSLFHPPRRNRRSRWPISSRCGHRPGLSPPRQSGPPTTCLLRPRPRRRDAGALRNREGRWSAVSPIPSRRMTAGPTASDAVISSSRPARNAV